MAMSPDELQYQLASINDDRSNSVIVGVTICALVAYIFVIFRYTAHKQAKTSLQPDDWAIAVALIILTGQCIDLAIGVNWGLGRHAILLTEPVNFGRNTIAAESIYLWAIAAVKLSIILLWNRLFTSRTFRITIWITAVLIMLWTIAGTLVVVLQCVPIEALWDPSVAGKCIDMATAATIFGAINVFTDLLIILLPVKQLLKLRLETRDKLQLLGLFMTGGLVTIISVARMFYTIRMGAEDVTWTYVDAGIWSSAEISAAIVSACLPTLRPLFTARSNRLSGVYLSYPSARESMRRSEMYQVNSRESYSPAKPASAKIVPSWRDAV